MKRHLPLLAAAVIVSALVAPSFTANAALPKATPKLAERTHVKAPAKGPAKTQAKQIELPQTRQWAKGANQFAPVANRPKHLSSLRSVKNAPALAPAATEVYGAMIYNADWEEDQTGMYSFSTGTSCVIDQVVIDPYISPSGGGAMTPDGYVCTNYFSLWGWVFITNYTFDEDWNLTGEYDGENSSLATDMAYDATTGDIYGCFYTDDLSGFQFGILDTESWSSSQIALLDRRFTGVAASSKGEIYGIDVDGVFVKFDKTTGAYEEIASTGIEAVYTSSAAIDPATDVFYYMPCGEAGVSLYAIDLATGQATEQYYLGDAEVVGMYFPIVTTPDDGPAPVENVVLDFADGSLSGTISFTAPATLYDGTTPAADATLNYTITANGGEVASGTCAYGEQVTAQVTLPDNGNYKFVVTVSNEAGASPAVKAAQYIGFDTPKAIDEVVASYADGTMRVTWTPVDASVNGGYMGAISYTVSCNGEVLAQALTDCEYEYAVAEPEALTVYQYSVQAVAEGLASAPTLSNAVTLGQIIPPFTESFSSDPLQAGWTVINVNADHREWTWDGSEMMITYTNSGVYQDDWLVTPPVRLEEGKYYEFSFLTTNASSYYPERIEAAMGTEPTADAMTTILVEPTDLIDGTWLTLSKGFIAPAAGTYYFGIHAISDPDQYTIYVTDVAISGAKEAAAPAAVENLKVANATDGTPTATISFTAPTQTIGGADLASISSIDVYCDGELINTVPNAQPGSEISCTYAAPAMGTYEFEVVATNDAGVGLSATVSAYLGINIAAAPAEATVVETTPGVVEINWTASDTDVDGQPMNPAFVTYTIIDYNGIVAEGLTDTSYTYQAMAEGEQDFVSYAIYAVTEAGYSRSYTETNVIACGTPWDAPFVETFADGALAWPWAVQNNYGSVTFGVVTDGYFEDVNSAAGDNGMLYMSGSGYYYSGSLISGKINVDLDSPELSYYWYSLGLENENTIDVQVLCDGELTTVNSHDLIADRVDWYRTQIDMSAYKGKTVQLYFTITVNAYVYTFIDDIRLENPLDYDLAVTGISSNASTVKAGSDIEISYTLANYGVKDAEGYTVSLYCNGDLVQSAENLPAIPWTETYTGTFTHSFDALKAGTYEMSVEAYLPGDEDPDNNASTTVQIVVKASNYPSVDLSGEYVDGQGVVLTWEAPYLDTAPRTIVEDFESIDYEPFTMESFGPWTLRNYNDDYTYSMSGIFWPNAGEPFGYILYCPEEVEDNDPGMVGYGEDGNFLAAVAHESGANDAWLISPELPGSAQTVTFMARSYSDDYGLEEIAAYYSTTDNERDSFIEMEIGGYSDSGVPTDWTQFSLDLPEGTKYFAIVSTSYDIWILMLDDISYVGYSDFGNLVVEGYNVYRDGDKINSELVTNTSYVDTEATEGTYIVTVVYAQGESAPSNAVEVKTQGIEDLMAQKARVQVVDHTIIVLGSDNVVISAADGKVIRSAKGQARVEATVSTGVYMVKTTDGVAKVIVK